MLQKIMTGIPTEIQISRKDTDVYFEKLKEILFKVNIDSVYGDTNINVSKILLIQERLKIKRYL